MTRGLPVVPAAALWLALVAPPAHARQVFVQVGFFNTFVPANVDVNEGDLVIWTWTGAGHTVTSGDPVTHTPTGSGEFRSSTSPTGGTRYCWTAAGVGAKSYYCLPHAPTMAGVINVVASGASAADVRLTELEFAVPFGADRVQIHNFGSANARLDYTRFSTAAGTSSALNSSQYLVLAPGGSVTLFLNQVGTSTSGTVYAPEIPELPATGALALYAANNTTVAGGSLDPASLTEPAQMLDYVAWGTPGQPAGANEGTAVLAGLWNAGEVVNISQLPNGGRGYSIAFCGAATDHGASHWQIARPNFGIGAFCTTPAPNPTWGRIKSLYK